MVKQLYIFLILITQSVFCQQAFLKYYNKVGDYRLSYDRGQALLEVEDGYIVTGYIAEDEEYIHTGIKSITDTTRPMIIKVNKQGNVLWNKRYNNNTCNFSVNAFLKNAKNEYIGVGGSFTAGDTCGSSPTNPYSVDLQLYMQKINDSGDLIWQKTIGESVNKTGQLGVGITPTKDGNYFAIGSDDGYPWLLKINEGGDSLWTKKYASLYGNGPASISSINDGYLIFTITYTNTYISKINEQGDLLWTKNLPFRAEALTQGANGNFILSRTYKPFIQVFTIITNIDKEANVLWEKSYACHGTWALTFTNDGNYIIGAKDFAKVTPKGEILWNKRYWGANNITPSYYYLNVIATSDGGFLATGVYEMNTFLVKTDCNGNLEWDTNSCLLPTDKEVLIFPNPFYDNVTFQLPNINKDVDKVSIRITDLLGQILIYNNYENQNIFTLNLSTYAQGVYIYSVFVNGKIYKSDKIFKN
jgi:hypothetical protein